MKTTSLWLVVVMLMILLTSCSSGDTYYNTLQNWPKKYDWLKERNWITLYSDGTYEKKFERGDGSAPIKTDGKYSSIDLSDGTKKIELISANFSCIQSKNELLCSNGDIFKK